MFHTQPRPRQSCSQMFLIELNETTGMSENLMTPALNFIMNPLFLNKFLTSVYLSEKWK